MSRRKKNRLKEKKGKMMRMKMARKRKT